MLIILHILKPIPSLLILPTRLASPLRCPLHLSLVVASGPRALTYRTHLPSTVVTLVLDKATVPVVLSLVRIIPFIPTPPLLTPNRVDVAAKYTLYKSVVTKITSPPTPRAPTANNTAALRPNT